MAHAGVGHIWCCHFCDDVHPTLRDLEVHLAAVHSVYDSVGGENVPELHEHVPMQENVAAENASLLLLQRRMLGTANCEGSRPWRIFRRRPTLRELVFHWPGRLLHCYVRCSTCRGLI